MLPASYSKVLTFEFVDEILSSDHSNETSSVILSRGTICFLVRNLEFLVNISTWMESLQQVVIATSLSKSMSIIILSWVESNKLCL